MKKKDLKTGMIIQNRDGEYAMVLLNTPKGDIYSTGYQLTTNGDSLHLGRTWGYIDSFNSNLKYVHGMVIPRGDVIRVWDVPDNGNMGVANFSLYGRKLLWERVEKPKKVNE